MVTAAKPPVTTPKIAPGTSSIGGKSPLPHRPWWLTATETVTLATVAVFTLEIVLNLCGVGMEEILQPDSQMGMRHIPSKKVVWRMEGYSADSLNSQGLRDIEHSLVKPPGVFRIALLGDSATEGLQVPLEDTYARGLQSKLKVPGKAVEVINFGCSSYSTGQEVLQFEREVARYKPDLTILLYGRGDAVENVRKPTDLKTEPRPYFYIDPAGKLLQDDAVLAVNAASLKPNPVVDWLRRNSRLYGVFSHADLNLSINEPVYRKLRSWLTSPWKSPKLTRHAAAAYAVQDGWKVTSALLARLNNDCRGANSKFVVMTFPNFVNDPEFARQIIAMQEQGKSQGFGVFDLTPTFHWHPDPKRLFLKYHFSTEGHTVVAAKLAEFLQPQLSR